MIDIWIIEMPKKRDFPLNIEVRCLKGAEEICGFVQEDHRNINELVKNENLPAWKRGSNGTWRALNIDLRLNTCKIDKKIVEAGRVEPII